MLGQVIIVDLIILLVGVCWLEQNLFQQISQFKLMLGLVLTILSLSCCVNYLHNSFNMKCAVYTWTLLYLSVPFYCQFLRWLDYTWRQLVWVVCVVLGQVGWHRIDNYVYGMPTFRKTHSNLDFSKSTLPFHFWNAYYLAYPDFKRFSG